MTLLERIRNAWPWKPSGPRAYVGRKQGGVVVTEDTAQTYSAVNACVRLISETMAAIPWQVYRKLDTGREAMPRNTIQWLLNFQANPEQTAYVFKRTIIANYLLWGMGYAEVDRGLGGAPVWLWRLPPDRSTLERGESGELRVRVSVDGTQYILPRENVYLLSDSSYDGLTGASRIQLARRSIGAGMAQDTMAASIFANGAAIGGRITNKGKTLSPEAVNVLLGTFNEKYAGPDRASKTLYLDGGMEYSDGGAMPLTDAQFLENRRFQVEEICRWYGVPLHLVQDTSQANYAISYEASKNFVEHTLRPLAVLMEQEANVRLFGARSQGAIYSRMNLAGLLRADPRTRGEYYRSLINSGVMSINEVRELEELNSIGEDGDEHYMQLNMTTVERIADGDSVKTSAATPTAPMEPDMPKPDMPDNIIRREALAWWRAQPEQAHG
jgi:HK97 family phage portal protein